MKNKVFSIITVENNKEVFQTFNKNLKKQKDIDYELIAIDNENNQYSSARDAYRQAILQSRGKYLLFLHPDIHFLDSFALRDIATEVYELNDFGVIGVAGCPTGKKSYIVTSIFQGENREAFGTRIKRPINVQTVDECFFIMKRDIYDKIPFSTIKGWHFYAVEQCLRAIIIGQKNYVIPARIWHKSAGASEDSNYIKTGKIIINKYGQYFDSINTTITKWYIHGYFKRNILPWVKHWKRIMEWNLGIKK